MIKKVGGVGEAGIMWGGAWCWGDLVREEKAWEMEMGMGREEWDVEGGLLSGNKA